MLKILSLFAMSLFVFMPMLIPVAVTVVHAIVKGLRNVPSIGGAIRQPRRTLHPAV